MMGIIGKVLLMTENSVQLFSSKLFENTNLKCWVLGPSKMQCPGVKQEISLLSVMVPSIVITCHVCYHHLLWISIIISLQVAQQNHYHGSISCWPLFQFNATLVCVLNSLVFNFRRRSVWTGKLLLMCKLCTVFHSALFIFIIHLMLHFLAESTGFWKSTFLVPRVSFKTEWFFSNLIS